MSQTSQNNSYFLRKCVGGNPVCFQIESYLDKFFLRALDSAICHKLLEDLIYDTINLGNRKPS